ncbi:hypothetical protein [Massilia luteola]|uniref:hypothetical protein n=1 Tax=Massilia luteola TaxID=3081751 RepID=UPI002ACC1C47|nr:hypothetical protein [Massilia sp. Gc5]
MKTLTPKEAAALARLDDVGAAEINREEWWHLLPLRERERAVGVAGMPRERAGLPLATFNDQDRERVRLALAAHIAQMRLIVQCMAAHNTNRAGYLH